MEYTGIVIIFTNRLPGNHLQIDAIPVYSLHYSLFFNYTIPCKILFLSSHWQV